MDLLFAVGRVVFVIPFLIIGGDRIVAGDDAGRYPDTPTAGLVWIAGALSVGLGVFGDVGAVVLGVQLLAVAAIGHQDHDDLERTLPLLSLVGAALTVATVYAVLGEGLDYTLTDQLVSIDP